MVQLTSINGGGGTVLQSAEGRATVDECLAAFQRGRIAALYDLGIAYSTGSHGLARDLIEAHRWFNIAAAKGHGEAALCRADVADEMTAAEIAEAQRRARQWLAGAGAGRRAA